jgi:hypothetical protein
MFPHFASTKLQTRICWCSSPVVVPASNDEFFHVAVIKNKDSKKTQRLEVSETLGFTTAAAAAAFLQPSFSTQWTEMLHTHCGIGRKGDCCFLALAGAKEYRRAVERFICVWMGPVICTAPP